MVIKNDDVKWRQCEDSMRASIFGLGYVGCVSVACLSNSGFDVVGVDINKHKVELVNQGLPTIVEEKVSELLLQGHNAKLIHATTDANVAVMQTEVSFVCVGTPVEPNGLLSMDTIYSVANDIGNALSVKDEFHLVVIRSTVLPGTNEKFGKIIEHASGKKRGIHFDIVSNPEFIREGSAVDDYYNPAYILLGSKSKRANEALSKLYQDVNAEIIECDIEIAEIIKFVNNSFHALKITFANEIGHICKSLGIDSIELMEIFCRDTKLNISPTYLRPGFAYGGYCLPKDLESLVTIASRNKVNLPLLVSIEKSNKLQIELVHRKIREYQKKKVGFVGVSFKEGTDDIRNSPILPIIAKLKKEGYKLSIFDKNVKVAVSEKIGSSLEEGLLEYKDILCNNISELVERSEIIVINQKLDGLDKIKFEDKIIIDLAGIPELRNSKVQYYGICW